MLQPNDLPLVCLPLDLPPEAAAELVAFLHELADALERHYGAGSSAITTTIARAQRAAGLRRSVLTHRTRSRWASASGESALTPKMTRFYNPANSHEPRFADLPPSQIVPRLADEGTYWLRNRASIGYCAPRASSNTVGAPSSQ